ncbi:cupin domain-containing protein [Methylocella sp.]|uniref:cupin domain-containing protein n=1 Tax=Methylocella sp. TaxID=1978226 RepID=UPI00378376D5
MNGLSGRSAEEVATLLGLAPHPEGGLYRETFRDAALTAEGRAASTLIYFLLRAGERSRWHRVDAAEAWHFYAGAPVELGLAGPEAPPERHRLGADLFAGERPQLVVPAHGWQSAESLAQPGGWSLVGCQVAPGFEFSRFELAPPGWRPPGWREPEPPAGG